MKNLITLIAVLVATFSFSQNDNLEAVITTNEGKINDFKISVSVDSAEEIESTFKVNDFKEILEDVNEDELLSFEITCFGEGISEGSTTSLKYKVEGNSNDIKGFLKSIRQIRKAAIKYYNNK